VNVGLNLPLFKLKVGIIILHLFKVFFFLNLVEGRMSPGTFFTMFK